MIAAMMLWLNRQQHEFATTPLGSMFLEPDCQIIDLLWQNRDTLIAADYLTTAPPNLPFLIYPASP
jgi:hypothetical protein